MRFWKRLPKPKDFNMPLHNYGFVIIIKGDYIDVYKYGKEA